MSRYVITDRPWFTERELDGFKLQVTDLLDTRTGTTYADGAYRVVDPNGRRIGKVFKGETAWSQARNVLEAQVRFATLRRAGLL